MNNWEEIEKQVKRYAELFYSSCCGEDCRELEVDCLANIKGIVDAMESEILKVCSHGVSMQDVCSRCMVNSGWRQPEDLVDKNVCDYIAASSSYDLAQRQNERIAQLSKRIEQLESDLKKAFLYCTEINNKLDRFMDMCEENGKKREERIKSLEGFRLDVQSFINSCYAMDKRIKVLEDSSAAYAAGKPMKGH